MQIAPTDFPHLGEYSFIHGLFLNGMTGANARFGKSLIGPADEEQEILTGGIFAVDHRHRVTALVAEEQSLEQKVIGSDPGVLAAVDPQLHLLKSGRTVVRLHSD